MPEVVRLASSDDTRHCLRGQERLRRSRRMQHPADRGRAEVQTRTGQNPGDLDSPHSGAKDLEPSYDVADELGEPVHRVGETDKRVGTVFIETGRPGRDSEGSHEERARRLGEGPGSHRPKLQDGQALSRRVVGSLRGFEMLHAGVLDADLLAGQREAKVELDFGHGDLPQEAWNEGTGGSVMY